VGGCPAGINGRCNHVCATLFLFDSIHKQKLKMSRHKIQMKGLVHLNHASGIYHRKGREMSCLLQL
jgi:hypothetical protein